MFAKQAYTSTKFNKITNKEHLKSTKHQQHFNIYMQNICKCMIPHMLPYVALGFTVRVHYVSPHSHRCLESWNFQRRLHGVCSLQRLSMEQGPPRASNRVVGLAAAGGGRCHRGHRFGGSAGGCAIELPIHIPGGWIGVRRIITWVIPPLWKSIQEYDSLLRFLFSRSRFRLESKRYETSINLQPATVIDICSGATLPICFTELSWSSLFASWKNCGARRTISDCDWGQRQPIVTKWWWVQANLPASFSYRRIRSPWNVGPQGEGLLARAQPTEGYAMQREEVHVWFSQKIQDGHHRRFWERQICRIDDLRSFRDNWDFGHMLRRLHMAPALTMVIQWLLNQWWCPKMCWCSCWSPSWWSRCYLQPSR